MKVTQFNQANVKEIREEIDAALAAIAAKHGLASIRTGRITYSGTEFNAKITAKTASDTVSVSGVAISTVARNAANAYGLPTDIFDRDVVLQGTSFKIVDINPKKPKNCITICNERGTQYITSVTAIKRAIGMTAGSSDIINF
jgi:hypothetical protein